MSVTDDTTADVTISAPDTTVVFDRELWQYAVQSVVENAVEHNDVRGTLAVVGAGYARQWLDGLSLQFTDDSLRVAVIGIAVTVVVWALNATLTTVFQIDSLSTRLLSDATGPLVTAGLLAYVVLLAPVAEETLFRDAVQTHLRAVLGRWPAVLGGSIQFYPSTGSIRERVNFRNATGIWHLVRGVARVRLRARPHR